MSEKRKVHYRHSTGEITNYMAVDAKRFADAMPWLKDLWSLPLQIAVSIYLLFRVVGKAMFAGLSVMLFMAFVQYLLSKRTKALQQGRITRQTDIIYTCIYFLHSTAMLYACKTFQRKKYALWIIHDLQF